MKKLQKLVSFALVGALAFSLAACGNDGSKGGKEETDGAPDPSTIQCESVTAEQWAAAFDISEYTNATARVFQRVSVGGQRSDMTSVMRLNGNRAELLDRRVDTAINRTLRETSYVEKSGGEYFKYVKSEDTGKYEKKSTSAGDFGFRPDSIVSLDETTIDLRNAYDSFTPDQKNVYTAKLTDSSVNGGTEMNLTVMIADGKVAYVRNSYSVNTGGPTVSNVITIQIYDVGTTAEIVLPNVDAQ